MTSDSRERLRTIDPAPVDAEPPSGALDAAAVLHQIERRTGMNIRGTANDDAGQSGVATPGPPSPSPEGTAGLATERGPRGWPRALVAAAAFAVRGSSGRWNCVGVGRWRRPRSGGHSDAGTASHDAGTASHHAGTASHDLAVRRR